MARSGRGKLAHGKARGPRYRSLNHATERKRSTMTKRENEGHDSGCPKSSSRNQRRLGGRTYNPTVGFIDDLK